MANQGTADFDTFVFALFFRLPLKDSPTILLGTRIELFVNSIIKPMFYLSTTSEQPYISSR